MLGNWVRQTTTTTGTGNLTLSSVTGYPTFNDSFSTTQTFRYAILDDSTGQPIEIGIGHLSSSTVLVRDWVLATYVSGTYAKPNTASGQVNLAAGTKRVICTADATQHTQHYDNNPARLNATSNNRIILQDNLVSYAPNVVSIQNGGRLYGWPAYFSGRGPFDAFAIRVGTTASATVDIGLYQMDWEGKPDALLASKTGLVLAGGMNYGTFSAISISPGWYYLAIGSDVANPEFYHGQLSGPALGRSDTATSLAMTRVNYTAGTLPNPFGTPTSIGENLSLAGMVPLIGLRCS